jgi:polysaccharide pyruvyl transferase WcaK-like protein
MRIGLLGASFDTGNMGVGALTESSIKIILNRWPDAEVTLLDSGRAVCEEQLRIGGKGIRVKKLPIRFCGDVFLANHFIVFCLYGLLFKVFRGERFKRFCARRNACLNHIIQMNMVADITGGDSFSDIYGMRRFTLGFLRKWLVLLFNKDLIMLPQTYGPFKRPLARTMAKFILNRAAVVYSRDRAGLEYVNTLLNHRMNGKARFAPDVAFVLDAKKPHIFSIAPSEIVRKENSIVIGLNVSGLLFNGGYDRNNMFGLKANYPALVYGIIDYFMKNESAIVLLVPHVFSPKGTVESDPDVCRAVYEKLRHKYENRLFVVSDKYDQGQIKYIIGMSDFFIGSRMHACIASISQGIPVAAIAYSKKFSGVFESIGLADCVIDARYLDGGEALRKVAEIFKRRDQIRKHIEDTMPQVKQRVLNLFDITAVRD